MKNMNPAAKELNTAIQNDNPAILSILSDRAQAIFFPKSGIMAQTADAKGKKFNATIGIAKEEDGTPMRLQSIDKHIDLDPIDVYPYANSYGKLEIRELWQAMMKAKNPSIQSRISLPVVTPGLTHGLSTAAYLLLNPGETMLVTDKYWGNYRLTYSNCFGVNIKPFNTFKEGGFDCEAMREALFDGVIGKKVLLLNFPNNPSGYTPTDPEVDQIITIIKDYADAGGLLSVIVDDAYFGLIYEEGVYRESIFGKLADLHENVLAVKIDGATKEDYVWGYRVGFITFAT